MGESHRSFVCWRLHHAISLLIIGEVIADGAREVADMFARGNLDFFREFTAAIECPRKSVSKQHLDLRVLSWQCALRSGSGGSESAK